MITWLKNLFKKIIPFNSEKKVLKVINDKALFWAKDKTRIELVQYAKLICEHFEFEFFVQKRPFDSIKASEDLAQDIEREREYRRNEIKKYENESNVLKETIEKLKKDSARFEQEVIHLKELVQEKNMVIDKLMQDLNDKARA